MGESKGDYARFRGVRLVEVICLEVNEGEGVEGDPIVRVTYWYTKDGHLIGHDDRKDRAMRGSS